MNIEDICKTGPTVYSPHLRRLESVALQRQEFFLSYFKIPSVGPSGVELTTSHVASRCSSN